MHVHHALPAAKILEKCALTVGTFDGVHRGHQSLVARLRSEAATRDLPTAALTFVDMPFCFFRPDECPKLLALPAEKIAAFEQTGLDHLFIVPFDEHLAKQSAHEFMAFWKTQIGLQLFVGGPDFALGRGREGTIAALQTLGAELGFETLALEEKLLENGAPISSTRCRGVIEAGQVEFSRAFLGRPYTLAGEVVSGQQLGRTIGVPTINIRPHERKCLPKTGVYAIWARFDEQTFPAALNIGLRPTVDGTKLQIEFHVLDREIPVAPGEVEIEFVARLRDEQKFGSLNELVAQMHRDFARAREILT